MPRGAAMHAVVLAQMILASLLVLAAVLPLRLSGVSALDQTTLSVGSAFTSTWAKMDLADDSASEGPGGICDAMSAFEPVSRGALLLHGYADTDSGYNDDLFLLDLSEVASSRIRWAQLTDAATFPSTRIEGVFSLRNAQQSSSSDGEVDTQASFYLATGRTEDASWTLFDDEWNLDLSLKTTGSTSSSRITSPESTSWTEEVSSSSALASRAWTSAVWMWTSSLGPESFAPFTEVQPPHDVLVVFGGNLADGTDSNDLWLGNFTVDPLHPTWSLVTPTGDVQPPILSGHKAVVINREMWVSFGYSCTSGGDTSGGGNSCYSADLYVLGIDPSVPSRYLQWRSVLAADHSDQEWWPSNRAWHNAVAMEDRYIVTFGGMYVDISGMNNWYADVGIFDTVAEEWLPVPIRGTQPHIVTASSSFMVEENTANSQYMAVAGGCTTSDFYQSDVYVLRIGQYVHASNCTIDGPASISITAGETTWFTINAVDAEGDAITWGTGLSFSVFVGGRDAYTGLLGEVDSTVTELGGGVYNISFTASSGVQTAGCTQLTSDVQLTLRLDGVLLPGSPFSIPLLPGSTSADYITGSVSSLKSVAVRAHASYFRIYPSDEYGNLLLLEDNNATVVSRAGDLDLSLFDVQIDGVSSSDIVLATASDSDGAIQVAYTAPDKASYSIHVTYAGAAIVGSPFLVEPASNMDITSSLNTAFIVLGFIGLAALTGLFIFVVVRRNDSRIRASSPTFLCGIVFGCMVGMSSLLLPASGRVTWAGGLSDASCQSYAWLMGLGASITFSAMMVKTHRIAAIFNSKHIRLVKMPDRELVKPVLVAVACEILFNALWQGIDPLKVTPRASSANGNVEILECNCDHLVVWEAVTFLVKFGGVAWAVKLAAAVRNAPGQFNEASALSAAISNCALCCVVLIPLVLFQALDQSPAVLYVLKQIITFHCFLFTPAIIILPKLYELDTPNTTQLPGDVKSGTGHGSGGVPHSRSGGAGTPVTTAWAGGAAMPPVKRASVTPVPISTANVTSPKSGRVYATPSLTPAVSGIITALHHCRESVDPTSIAPLVPSAADSFAYMAHPAALAMPQPQQDGIVMVPQPLTPSRRGSRAQRSTLTAPPDTSRSPPESSPASPTAAMRPNRAHRNSMGVPA